MVFTDPQVAAVGHTLESALAAGIPARAVDHDTSGVAGGSFYGRGAAGTSRLVVDEVRRVLVGATFTGPDVAEFVHAATVAIVGGVTLDQLWHATPSFPTRSEVWLRLLENYGLESRRVGAERDRLEEQPRGRAPWRRLGLYLSERAWGTVREDYSANGDAWRFFPHGDARSRVYRWNEDGLAGICDDRQTLCFALAFWNGRDPNLKERIFGLAGPDGNHGEDAKEYWWYLDSTPTHSWMRWRYMYPQAEFPYDRLLAESQARGKLDPEFELVDTGIFDDGRYWEITADDAKASPEESADPDRRSQCWPGAPRSTCYRRSGSATRGRGASTTRRRRSGSRMARSLPSTPARGARARGRRLGGGCCSATTRRTASGCGACPAQPVPEGRDQRPRRGRGCHDQPDHTGTKAAPRYRLEVGAGETATIELRLSEGGGLGDDFAEVMRRARGGGGRVLRHADPGRSFARRGARAPPGARRDALVEAVLPLRHPPLAGRRPGRPDPLPSHAWARAITTGRTSTTST